MATSAGSTDFSGAVYVDSDSVLTDSDFTVCCWQYTDSNGHLNSSLGSSESGTAYIYCVDSGGLRYKTQIGATGTPNLSGYTSSLLTSNGLWAFVACVHDSSANTAAIFASDGMVNIELLGTGGAYGGSPIIGTGDLRIGGFSAFLNFDGQIAHAQAHSEAFTESQLREVQWNPGAMPGTTLTWQCLWDSTFQKDLSPNQTDGAVSGAPTSSSNGPPIFLLGGQ